jgi:predicted peptidase
MSYLFSPAVANPPPSHESFTAELRLGVGYRYLLSLPAGYDADPARRWPLIVFLHGAGERGDQLEPLLKHGPPRLMHEGKDLPAIVVSPLCPAGELWVTHGVKALVDEVCAKLRVDATRLYLTGLSMGGFATWETALDYPATFAALVPICGGAGVRFLQADRIKHIPSRIYHGAKDPVVPLSAGQQIHEAMLAAGADTKLTIYPEAEHDSWTEAYASEELWQWLFAQVQPVGE